MPQPDRLQPLLGPLDAPRGHLGAPLGQQDLEVGSGHPVGQIATPVSQTFGGHPLFDAARPLGCTDAATGIQHLGELDRRGGVVVVGADIGGAVAGHAGNEAAEEHITAELTVAAGRRQGWQRARTGDAHGLLRKLHLGLRRGHLGAVLQGDFDGIGE